MHVHHRSTTAAMPLLLTGIIVLGGCDGGSTTGPDSPQVSAVVVTAPANTVEQNETLQLTAQVQPAGAPQSVTWSTSDPSIASVSAAGLVTGVKDGSVTITARSTAAPSLSGTLSLTVTCGIITTADVANGATLPPDTCYEARSPVTVSGGTLNVREGVRILFATNAHLTIASGGSLNAIGTEAKPIIFTSAAPLERWRGVNFDGSRSASNVLRYVRIANGGSVGWSGASYSTSAVLLQDNALVDIQNSRIVGSGGQGITAYGGSDLVFENNSLAENVRAAWMHPDNAGSIGATTTFSNNTENVVRVVFTNTDAVNGARTWQKLAVPFVVQDRFFVDAALALAPGATIEFVRDASVIVRNAGSINADGTDEDLITLRGAQNLSGYWKGLQITTASVSNVFDHVVFENGGSQPWTGNGDSRAMVYLEGNSKAVFTNSTFRGSAHYGLWVPAGADISGLENNTFTANARALIVHPNRAGAVANSNEIQGNTEDRIRVTFGNTDAVTTAQRWGHVNTPYLIMDRTFVHHDLSIEGGAVLEFSQNASLRVTNSGSLSADGVDLGGEREGVTFRGAQDLVGYWQGIEINTASTRNRLTAVDILNAGSQPWFGGANSTASINVTGAGALNLSDVLFAKTGGYAMIVRSGGQVMCSGVNHGGFMFFDSGANTALAICP